MLFLRWYLVKENKRRDILEATSQVSHKRIVESLESDGTKKQTVVSNNQLDLTDRENLEFRYVLWADGEGEFARLAQQHRYLIKTWSRDN